MSEENQTPEEETLNNSAESGQTSEREESDASKRRRQRRQERNSAIQIVNYNDASDEQRDVIDSLISPIEEDPQNADLILEFGLEATQNIGEIADRMAEFNEQWSSKSNSFYERDIIGQTAEKLKEVADLRASLENAAGLGSKSKQLANKTINKVSGMFKSIKGFREKKAEHDKFISETDKVLPTLLGDIEQLMSDLEETLVDLEVIDNNSRELGDAWREAVEQLCVYASAGNRLIEIFETEILPEAQEDDDEMYLQEIVDNMELLSQQVQQLKNKALVARNATIQMKTTSKNITYQRQQIRNILNNSDFSNALAQTTGIQLASMKVNKQIERGQNMNTDLIDMSIETGANSQKMLDDARDRGVVDTTKALEQAGKVVKMLEDTKQRAEKRRTSEKAQQRLLEQALNQVSDAERKALEDAGKTAEGDGKKKLSLKRPSNDDSLSGDFSDASEKKESALEKAKAAAAAKAKKNNGGPGPA